MAEDYPGHLTCLNTLAKKLCYWYEQTGYVKDLKEVIKMTELVVEAIPHGHSDQAAGLEQLGILLKSQFEWTRNIKDLKQAIQLKEQVV